MGSRGAAGDASTQAGERERGGTKADATRATAGGGDVGASPPTRARTRPTRSDERPNGGAARATAPDASPAPDDERSAPRSVAAAPVA